MNDAFSQPQSAVVLGGSSDIARAIMARLVAGGCQKVVLAGRPGPGLAAAAQEMTAAGAEQVALVHFDAASTEGVGATVEACLAAAGGPVDLVLVAVGLLGRQEADETDPAATARVATVNFAWPAAALVAVAEAMRRQGQGRIVVLSSVAGVRVRRANFLYGSAKAGLDAFGLNLGEALRGSGVQVMVVRPGFVRTSMTEGMKAAPMSVGPEDVAEAVVAGLAAGATVLWVPGALRWVFLVLRHLPRFAWRRLPG